MWKTAKANQQILNPGEPGVVEVKRLDYSRLIDEPGALGGDKF
jgi:hypothetical protein